MALPGEIQSLVDVLASVGKDTAGGLLGVADYARGKITGEDVSASDALARGRALTGDDWYTPGPEGEAVNRELLQALAGTVNLAGMGIPGSGHLAREGAEQLSRLDENVKAGLELAASVLDVTPAGLVTMLPASLLKMSGSADEIMQAIILFHGGPHRWSRPDPLGPHSGTGVQMYGAGLYTADRPHIADHYAKMTSHKNKLNEATFNGMDIDDFRKQIQGEPDGPAMWELISGAWDDFADGISRGVDDYGSGEDITAHFLDYIANPQYGFVNTIDELGFDWSPELVNSISKRLDNLTLGPDRGYLYEMEVPDERVADMLDWDRKLSEQEAWTAEFGPGFEMREREGYDDGNLIMRAIREDWTGGELYKELTEQLGDQKAVSEYLNEFGVPGLQQWDPHYGSDTQLRKMRSMKLAGLSDDEIVDAFMRMYHGAVPLDMEANLRRRLAAPAMGRNFVLFNEKDIGDIKRTEIEDTYEDYLP
jgi:hypothetical protein